MTTPTRLSIRRLASLAALAAFVAIPASGLAWTTPAPLNSNASSDTGQDYSASLAPTGPGSWVAVWQTNTRTLSNSTAGYGIAVARSTDNGATWTTPAPLHANARASSGDMAQPKMAADQAGRCVAIWTRRFSSASTLGQILVSRSSDYGATWSNPAPIADDEPDADLNCQIATDGNGVWIAVWATSNAVRFSRSTDYGATWSNPANLSFSSNKGGLPELATDGHGTWILTWTASVTDNDIVAVRSTDHGQTWSTIGYLNPGANNDSSHEWLSQVATDGNGNWMVVWQNYFNSSLSLTRSTDNGASWSTPRVLFTTFSGQHQPALETDASGHWVLIWERIVSSSRADLMTATSTDNGLNWSGATALLTDSSIAIAPVLAVNPHGRWLTAWHDDTLPASGSTRDYDLFVSTQDTPLAPRARISSAQHLKVVTSNGGGFQELFYNYDTRGLFISPYGAVTGTVTYTLPEDQWIGIYHYDYGSGRFSRALYQTKDPL